MSRINKKKRKGKIRGKEGIREGREKRNGEGGG